jgi:hypothetical protein
MSGDIIIYTSCFNFIALVWHFSKLVFVCAQLFVDVCVCVCVCVCPKCRSDEASPAKIR